MAVSEEDYRRAVRGSCYLAAHTLFLALAELQPNEGRRLCHAVVRQSAPPHVIMGHAFLIEPSEPLVIGGPANYWVRDALFPFTLIPQDRYYKIGQVQHVVQYTLKQAVSLSEEFDDYGPWDETVAAAAHAE